MPNPSAPPSPPTTTTTTQPTETTTMEDTARTLLSLHFLRRLGLTSDELYWPTTDDASHIATVDTAVPEAWRVRDAITDILKDNGVDVNIDGEDSKGELISISSIIDHILPNDMDVAKFKSLHHSDQSIIDVDGGKLNMGNVYKAFDAAACSIVRGHKSTVKPVITHEELHDKNVYEPPLVQALESIRKSRVHSLNEASGKSVPQFLKKNNTIPWFHVPILDQKTQKNKQADAILSTAVKKAAARKLITDVTKMKIEAITEKKITEVKKEEKKEEEEEEEKKPPAKRPAPDVKEPAEKKTKLDIKVDNSPKPKPKSPPKQATPSVTPKQAKSPPIQMGKSANVSRAIICAAAAMVFQKSTPDFDGESSDTNSTNHEWTIDPTIMPKYTIEVESAKRAASKKKRDLDISVDVAIKHATLIGERVLDRMLGATRRYDQRVEFRLDIAMSRTNKGWMSKSSDAGKLIVAPGHSLPMVIPNPFMEEGKSFTDNEAMDTDEDCCLTDGPVHKENDAEWSRACLPRLLSILRTGSGHAILHDTEWKDRSFRVAELLQNMASPSDTGSKNLGPHLIVTTAHDINAFAKAFGQIGHDLRVVRNAGADEKVTLRVLKYHGQKGKRRRMRKHFGTLSPPPDSPYCFLGGQADSPYHVVLTTYSAFAEDYAHFCQIPFQAVIMDDSMSWLGSANADPSTKLGKVWDTALWSSSDHGAGMAGVISGPSSWDFSKDDGGVDNVNKSSKVGFMRRDSSSSVQAERTSRGKLLVGLTARHRLLLASNMHAYYHGQIHTASVSSLLSFLVPPFIESIQEDWDKSKILQCDRSTSYLRKLIARSVVVYTGGSHVSNPQALFSLALKSLNGGLLTSPPSPTKFSPGLSPDARKQATLQRKDALAWFRPGSALLSELNDTSLDFILNALKRYNSMGYVCEEIVPASSLTASGANGAVTGPSAFRMGTRCGRQFTNEQSLKQHLVSFHAPAGTWLCKICGVDCVTSLAKSNHERTCLEGETEEMIVNAAKSAAPDLRRGPKRKEIKGLAAAKVKDNSKRVQGFNNVWVSSKGYFIKIEGKVVEESKQDELHKGTPLLFDTAEDAAKRHDQILKDSGRAEVSEMNYKPDGSRIYHKKQIEKPDDAGTAEGGSSVTVPALAMVKLENLPKHIKPLLRDPNQTSRTGGMSKRYVYAYRGVCRQARKGHDRWQAQISFNGFNHYLGTFDSEWDAAAIYAWAHLILYGEEATKRAQKEGEEAAAAYEQLQKDIAEGKLPPSALTSPKKKKKPLTAPKGPRPKKQLPQPASTAAPTAAAAAPPPSAAVVATIEPKKEAVEIKSQAKVVREQMEPNKEEHSAPQKEEFVAQPKESTYTSIYSKKIVPKSGTEWTKLKTSCAMMLSSGTKGTSKANLLASRKQLASMNNYSLLENVSERLTSGSTLFLKNIMSFGQSFESMPTCIGLTSYAPASMPSNGAMLIGLSAAKFCWNIEDFIAKCLKSGATHAIECASKLGKEFGRAGSNASFRSLVLSTPCTIGKAKEASIKSYRAVGIKNTVGMSVGKVDCDVGGPDGSCGEAAARIELMTTSHGRFQLLACNNEDMVTLNGKRIHASGGPFPLKNYDVVSCGARVFLFVQSY